MPTFAPYKSLHDVPHIEGNLNTGMKDDSQYEALQTLDAHSDSSTEVDYEDIEGDTNHRGRRKTFWSKLKRYRWILDTALLIIIIGLLVDKKRKDHDSHAYEFAGDITGFAPTFSQQITTWTPDPVFAPENAADFWSNETQYAWLSIVPEGLGYVNVKSPSSYNNLPHPVHDYPNHTVFTTSVTHQLHCLYTILEAYNSIKLTLNSPVSANPIKMPWHINHCFEYLRQAVMCAGDVALEGAATSFPGEEGTGADRGGSDGWDAKHVCKDYGQIYEYLERETINHYKWIATG